jgi:hypothetical protein
VLIANVGVGLSGSHERSTFQTSVAAPRTGGHLGTNDLGDVVPIKAGVTGSEPHKPSPGAPMPATKATQKR